MNKNVYEGIHPKVRLKHFSKKEKDIIKNLSNEFYVTNGGTEIKLGYNSKYKYFIIKPTDEYVEMFNIEREIVVIFSPYESFEPRTLDAINYVYKKFERHRLEKICSIIISKDTRVEYKIQDIIKNDKESQILIPFSYKELLNINNPYFMKNRFKKHFYTRDLFAFESPLKKDIYFFGRNDMVYNIANRHKSKENSGLFGLRKTGKTSVIFGIMRTLEKMDEKFVFIDCQSPAFHKRRWNKALFFIISEIIRQNKLNINLIKEDKYTEENAPLIFEKQLKTINKKLNNNILLIFDEIENITFNISPTKHWANELDFIYFWQTLRSLFQKTSLFTYLIVGTNPKCIETSSIQGFDNPIYNQIPYQYISGFDVSETKEMVSKLGSIMGLFFNDIIYAKLTEDFGGHPFLIRHVCSLINKISPSKRPTKIDKSVYREAKRKFNEEYSNYINMILEVLKEFYGDEYEILKLLAIEDYDSFYQHVNTSTDYVNHLLGYNIISRNNNNYTFQIETVKKHLCKKQKYKRLNLSQSEMLQEISNRRNEVEPKIRKIIRTQLMANYGVDEAKKIILKIMGKSRKKNHENLSYSDLFNPRKSKIYFNDLKKVILKEWKVFKNIFSKGKQDFERIMEAINLYRNDAHAKKITQNEMRYFRMCIEVIETDLNNFL